MSTHRITAGHGFVYLTSQTVINDGAAFRPGGLASYYAQNGEAPGRWMGRGLDAVGLAGGDLMLEEQMIALFGEPPAKGVGPPRSLHPVHIGRAVRISRAELERYVTGLDANVQTRTVDGLDRSSPAF